MKKMSLFKKNGGKKAEKPNRILVKSGEDDWRSYPEIGSLLHVDLKLDNAKGIEEKFTENHEDILKSDGK